MKIAIIGAGNVGQAHGAGWHRAGHAIAYGVRDPSDPKHHEMVVAIGASVSKVAQAIVDADIIVLAVHWDAVPGVLAECGDLTGRILIDVTNPLAFTPEGMQLAFGFDTSAGEQVAALAKGALVVKTLNQVGAAVMANAHRPTPAPVMFVASDHESAKATVTSLVRDLGFDALDGGPLKTARLLEPFGMLWIDQVYGRGAAQDSAFAFIGSPVSAA